jgi:hypothetical protein
LKLTHFVLVSSLIFLAAAFCAAQNASGPETSGANQSPQPPATAPGQTPEQTPPPAKPSAGQPPAQPADQTQSQSQGQNGQNSRDATNDESGTSGTSKDRLFFALPNFLTLENAGQVPPLTTGQKYKVVALGSFDPMQIVWYGALSGICQAENCEPGYGQGWAAYAKRFGAYAADGTIENFFVGAILPSMLHQDPRYFQ